MRVRVCVWVYVWVCVCFYINVYESYKNVFLCVYLTYFFSLGRQSLGLVCTSVHKPELCEFLVSLTGIYGTCSCEVYY